MRKWLLILGCMVIAGGGAAYYFLQAPGTENAAAAAQARSVQATEGNLEVKVSGTGAVAAADTVTVKTGYQGTISKVLIAAGDQVKKGQVLAQFEKVDNSTDIQQKKLDMDKQDLEILSLKDQYWLESDADKKAQLKLDLDSAKLSLEQLQKELADLETVQNENHDVTAPINGTVTSLTLSVGDNVNTGTDAAVLTDYSKLVFAINADELDVPKLKVGQSAAITLNALTDKTFTGKISSIAQEGTSSNGVATYPVTLTLDDQTGMLAGMSGSAEIVADSAENAVLVPIEAVVTMGSKSYVRVPNGTAGAVTSGGQGTNGAQGSGGSGYAATNGGGNRGGNRGGAGAGAGTQGGTAAGGTAGAGAQGGSAAGGTAGGAAGGSAAGGTAGAGTQGGTAAGAGTQQLNSRMALGGQFKEVTIGLANDTYVQIKSGLAAGDTVLVALPTGTVGGSTGQTTTRPAGMGGGMGGAGGGFAGGGGGARPGGGGGGQ